MKRVWTILGVAAGLLAFVLAIALSKSLVRGSGTAPPPSTIAAQLRTMADNLSKGLPAMVNADVQATAVGAVGDALVYRYNFTSPRSALADPTADYYQNTLSAVCSNPDTRALLNSGARFEYEYYDSENVFLTRYAVTSDRCPTMASAPPIVPSSSATPASTCSKEARATFDAFRTLLDRCTNIVEDKDRRHSSSGLSPVLDRECLRRLGHDHPYCPCFVADNPRIDLHCGAGT